MGFYPDDDCDCSRDYDDGYEAGKWDAGYDIAELKREIADLEAELKQCRDEA